MNFLDPRIQTWGDGICSGVQSLISLFFETQDITFAVLKGIHYLWFLVPL